MRKRSEQPEGNYEQDGSYYGAENYGGDRALNQGNIRTSPSFRADDQGPHAEGIGPKGYKREDVRIYEELCERLTRDHMDASGIEVSVSDAEVTLRGTVPDLESKYRAEHLAESVRGILEIVNLVRVEGEG